ncbi:SDR family NAD(P)-dependent oxidoreductase [Sphingobium abikonense]|jgi:NAD(P)-dependent dehydrogenase (short-subunit alcohol dehydrogenase family)|uniref:SDR family NAD(P)-dependent oxidoreductase n=1 Tax=Sphingobium abikonense TaxID=86193 RepID=UPI00078988F6|nr:glucose 1-dehydrogenase [Sphingobium abikonense]
MIDLSGKVALVTGAASAGGLGFAGASIMAAQGASLFLTDLDGAAVEARAAELRAAGHKAAAMAQDVTDEAQWDSVRDAVLAEFGKIDILVNNAGIAVLRHMNEITAAEWHRQISVNLDSVFLGTRMAMAQMRAQGQGGSIINLSSVAGLFGLPGCGAYSASKGGVRLFTKSVALEVAAENIRINSIHPGMIWTDMQKVAIADNKDVYDQLVAAIPMRKLGEPKDIGNMVAFLASDEAAYITGAEFVVDGGMVAQ